MSQTLLLLILYLNYMFKSETIFVLLSILVIISSSCSKKKDIILPEEMQIAERVMWSRPDSALKILENIPRPGTENPELDATWCLLLLQARDKNYISHLPDSSVQPSSKELINTAFRYFDKNGDARRKSQAYFYQGRVLEDFRKNKEAVGYYLKAKEIVQSQKDEDSLFLSLICQIIGSIYRSQELYEESLIQLKDGCEYAFKSGDGESIVYALSSVGRTYTDMGNYDSASVYFQRCYDSAKKYDLEYLQGMARYEQGIVYYELGEIDKALPLIYDCASITEKYPNMSITPTYNAIAMIHYKLGNKDSACYYFNKVLATKTTNIMTLRNVYSKLYELSLEQKKYEDAIKYKEQYSLYNDSIINMDYAVELQRMQYKYDTVKMQKENEELEVANKKQKIIALIIIIILLSVSLFVLYALLKKERLINNVRARINSYQNQIKHNEKIIKEKEFQITKYGETLEKINQIKEECILLRNRNDDLQGKISYYENLLSPVSVNLGDLLSYYEQLKELKDCPRVLKEGDWEWIREWTNIQYNNFLVRLESDYPNLTDLDKLYCCLIKMGFTTSQISEYVATSPTSVTKHKQRLKQKMRNSQPLLVSGNFSLDEYIGRY